MVVRFVRGPAPGPGRGGLAHGEHRGDGDALTGQLQPVNRTDLDRLMDQRGGARRPCGCQQDPVVFGPGPRCTDPTHRRQWPRWYR